MNKLVKGMMLAAAGVAAVAVIATMSVQAAALILGLTAVGIGGLIAAGIVDPVDTVIRPVVEFVSKTVKTIIYGIQGAIKSVFMPKSHSEPEVATLPSEPATQAIAHEEMPTMQHTSRIITPNPGGSRGRGL